jgi:ferredoxin
VSSIFKPWPEPSELAKLTELATPLAGRVLVKGVKVGRPVGQGQLLAISQKPRQGSLRSPRAGVIKALNGREIILTPGPNRVGPARARDLSGLEGEELAEALLDLGLSLPEEPEPGSPLLVTALDPDPSLTLAQALWSEWPAIMSQGLAVAARLYPKRPRLLVWPSSRPAPNIVVETWPTQIHNRPFPWTWGPFLKKSLGLGYDRAARGVLDSRAIYLMGLMERRGRAPHHWPLAIQSQNYLVPAGLSPKNIFKTISLEPQPGDLVALGGLWLGRPLANLDAGLDAEVTAVHLIRARRLGPEPGPCRGCQACRAVCPLDLPIDRLGREPLSSWPSLSNATKASLALCPDCGQCALACPAHRPLRFFSSWIK